MKKIIFLVMVVVLFSIIVCAESGVIDECPTCVASTQPGFSPTDSGPIQSNPYLGSYIDCSSDISGCSPEAVTAMQSAFPRLQIFSSPVCSVALCSIDSAGVLNVGGASIDLNVGDADVYSKDFDPETDSSTPGVYIGENSVTIVGVEGTVEFEIDGETVTIESKELGSGDYIQLKNDGTVNYKVDNGEVEVSFPGQSVTIKNGEFYACNKAAGECPAGSSNLELAFYEDGEYKFGLTKDGLTTDSISSEHGGEGHGSGHYHEGAGGGHHGSAGGYSGSCSTPEVTLENTYEYEEIANPGNYLWHLAVVDDKMYSGTYGSSATSPVKYLDSDPPFTSWTERVAISENSESSRVYNLNDKSLVTFEGGSGNRGHAGVVNCGNFGYGYVLGAAYYDGKYLVSFNPYHFETQIFDCTSCVNTGSGSCSLWKTVGGIFAFDMAEYADELYLIGGPIDYGSSNGGLLKKSSGEGIIGGGPGDGSRLYVFNGILYAGFTYDAEVHAFDTFGEYCVAGFSGKRHFGDFQEYDDKLFMSVMGSSGDVDIYFMDKEGQWGMIDLGSKYGPGSSLINPAGFFTVYEDDLYMSINQGGSSSSGYILKITGGEATDSSETPPPSEPGGSYGGGSGDGIIANGECLTSIPDPHGDDPCCTIGPKSSGKYKCMECIQVVCERCAADFVSNEYHPDRGATAKQLWQGYGPGRFDFCLADVWGKNVNGQRQDCDRSCFS